jgi:hypothetical protein
VTADFNNDSKLDLATADTGGNTVSVLLGDGRGGFGATNQFAAGTEPVSVTAGDFNKDGHPDLATVNWGSNDASVLLGDGAGAFRPPVSTAIVPGPRAVAAADFNADGTMDLVYSSSDDEVLPSSVEVLVGDGRGGFAARHRYDVRTWNPNGLAVADLNGDRRPDVVTANAGSNGTVSVLLGNGDGILFYDFSSSNFATGPFAMDVAVGDFTGDRIADLVTTGWDTGWVDVLPGRGDGTFAAPIRSVANIASSLAAADFNGDGRLDVLTTDSDSEFAELLLGRGDGTFSRPDWIQVGAIPMAVEIADFNADGRPDVVVADNGWDGNGVATVFLNDGDWRPDVWVSDATVLESNTGTASATFIVALSHATNSDVTVHFDTADITAAAGSDYTAASGVVIIPAGQTSATFTVAVRGDRLLEADETFAVNLSSPTNAIISDGQGVGSIVDDEPRISISDVSKTEGKKNQTTLFTFTVTLFVPYDQPVTMSFQTVNGTATTGDNDYVARTGTLTFAPGETTKTITIEVKGDTKKESHETFYLDLLGNSSNSLITKKRGIGTILNDD